VYYEGQAPNTTPDGALVDAATRLQIAKAVIQHHLYSMEVKTPTIGWQKSSTSAAGTDMQTLRCQVHMSNEQAYTGKIRGTGSKWWQEGQGGQVEIPPSSVVALALFWPALFRMDFFFTDAAFFTQTSGAGRDLSNLKRGAGAPSHKGTYSTWKMYGKEIPVPTEPLTFEEWEELREHFWQKWWRRAKEFVIGHKDLPIGDAEHLWSPKLFCLHFC